MTLQQMEYITAVARYGQFVKAAEVCGITQSTLSTMIQKLEQELDVQLFDRTAHPIRPTPIGEKVLARAREVLYHAGQLREMVRTEREQETGDLALGVIPTVAPYILPGLFKTLRLTYPGIALRVQETRTSVMVERLERGELDMGLLATPIDNPNLLEIPIYYEKFVAYISPSEPLYRTEILETQHIPTEHLWVLQEGHCLRGQVMNICEQKTGYAALYEAGSIDTLVKIVDTNGGFTVIPELHVPLLREDQRVHLRPIIHPEPVREISLVVRQDFVRERLLNILADTVRSQIPDTMVDARLKKFAIRL